MWYEEAGTYVGYAALGGLLAFVLAVIAILGEYYIEILLGIGILLGTFSIFFSIGSVIGIVYLVAWILEESGAIEANYIDETLNVILVEWYESFTAVEWVRTPMIYFEYCVTLYLGLNEFDPTDERFEKMFMLLATPFLW